MRAETSARGAGSGETGLADMVPPLRFVTAASLFDGHDAAINVMRRLIQGTGIGICIQMQERCVNLIVLLEDGDLRFGALELEIAGSGGLPCTDRGQLFHFLSTWRHTFKRKTLYGIFRAVRFSWQRPYPWSG